MVFNEKTSEAPKFVKGQSFADSLEQKQNENWRKHDILRPDDICRSNKENILKTVTLKEAGGRIQQQNDDT